MTDAARRLGVTLGDPAGIGPELVIRAFLQRRELDLPPFVAIGATAALEAHANAGDLSLPIHTCVSPAAAEQAPDDALPLIPIGGAASVTPGQVEPDGARTAIAAIERAVEYAQAGEIGGIVTQPIHKANMKAAGFAFPGHTEFLAALAAPAGATPPQPVMMLASEDGFRVVPVTIHIPLNAVSTALTTDLIVSTGAIVASALKTDFGIDAPRIAVAGLNPHAGENGTIGSEDTQIIAPAVAELRKRGIDATGPFPGDTLFHAEARRRYDAALAMYHDQALIPIKTVAFDDAVNVTLGLPFVRTSPDHGTALDIAGTGTAKIDSFTAALRMADRIARVRHG